MYLSGNAAYIASYLTTFCKSRMYFILLGRPYITRNPADVVAETTRNVNFYAQAGGHGPFTYQWYHNRNGMPGKTSHTLHINNIKLGNRGSYYCRICNRDGYCVSSHSAQLTVTGMHIAMNVYICIMDVHMGTYVATYLCVYICKHVCMHA